MKTPQIKRGRPALTGWFKGYVNPARPGVYERFGTRGQVQFSRWDGKRWMRLSPGRALAAATKVVSRYQKLPWRGLARPTRGAL